MNSTGLNIIKTLGCMTAVTFFTIYNTWDSYDYDYHWIGNPPEKPVHE